MLRGIRVDILGQVIEALEVFGRVPETDEQTHDHSDVLDLGGRLEEVVALEGGHHRKEHCSDSMQELFQAFAVIDPRNPANIRKGLARQ